MTSKFAKRHYEFIAQVMQASHPRSCGLDADICALAQWDKVVREFAISLCVDNSSFNRERFVAACQPGANVRARTRYQVLPANLAFHQKPE